MKVYSESQAKKLTGLIELISDKEYPLSGAKRRCEGGMPSDMTPGGIPIIIGPLEGTGSRQKRYHAAWYVKKARSVS